MTHPRKFRFGLQPSKAASGDEWAVLAREACGNLRERRERRAMSSFVLRADALNAAAPIIAELAGP